MQSNTTLCNISENFTREIRYILIYKADDLSFNENLRGDYPPTEDYLVKIPIHNISEYKRNIRLKKDKKNDFLSVDIRIPYLELGLETRNLLRELHKSSEYLIVAVSNKDTMLLGNHRERLSIEVIDQIDDNGLGKDKYVIKIQGKTIVVPRLRKVSPAFRVLLFAPPFA